MDVYREDNRFCIEAQGIYASFPDSEANRKTVVVLLRWLRHSREGRPLFTHQELAAILKSGNRQAASEHAEQFRACGEDFEAFIRRKRKVDEAVVEAVFSELRCDPLCSCEVLRRRVQVRLGRMDLIEANIRAAFEQIPYARLRPILKRLLEQGQAGLAYREEALIEDLLSHFEAEEAPKAGLSVPSKTPDLSASKSIAALSLTSSMWMRNGSKSKGVGTTGSWSWTGPPIFPSIPIWQTPAAPLCVPGSGFICMGSKTDSKPLSQTAWPVMHPSCPTCPICCAISIINKGSPPG